MQSRVRVGDREGVRRVLVYPGYPGIMVSNPSVALRPNEEDLERFEIAASGILMVTNEVENSGIIHGIML